MAGQSALLAAVLTTAVAFGTAAVASEPSIPTMTPTGPGAASPAPAAPAKPLARPADPTPAPTPAGEDAGGTTPELPVARLAGKSDYEHGRALYREGNYDGAGSAFARFIADNPGHPLNPNARHWLGRSELDGGRYQDSVRSFKAAYHGNARTVWAPRNLLLLAEAYDRLGRSGEACGALRLAARHALSTAAQRFRATRELERLSCL